MALTMPASSFLHRAPEKAAYAKGPGARPPRHTLALSGGSSGSPRGKEAINWGTCAGPGAWDKALPWNALLFVIQLGLPARLLCQALAIWGALPIQIFSKFKLSRLP